MLAKIKLSQLFGESPFGKIELGQIDQCAALPVFVQYQSLLGNQPIERTGNLLGLDFEQFDGFALQVAARRGAVATGGQLLQDIFNSGAGAQFGIFGDAEFLRDAVGGQKTDAVNIARQTVRVALNQLDGPFALGFMNPEGARRAHAVTEEKTHDLADALLLRPRHTNRGAAARTNPLDLEQFGRRVFDHVKHIAPESLHQPLGIFFADAANHAGAEKFFDAVERVGLRNPHGFGFKLLSVMRVGDPFAVGGQPLAGIGAGNRADHRDEVFVPANFDAQHGVAVFLVAENDPLDLSVEAVVVGFFSGGIHF